VAKLGHDTYDTWKMEISFTYLWKNLSRKLTISVNPIPVLVVRKYSESEVVFGRA